MCEFTRILSIQVVMGQRVCLSCHRSRVQTLAGPTSNLSLGLLLIVSVHLNSMAKFLLRTPLGKVFHHTHLIPPRCKGDTWHTPCERSCQHVMHRHLEYGCYHAYLLGGWVGQKECLVVHQGNHVKPFEQRSATGKALYRCSLFFTLLMTKSIFVSWIISCMCFENLMSKMVLSCALLNHLMSKWFYLMHF